MTDRLFSIGQSFKRSDETGDDLIVEMAFASEEPYQRWWGIEKLVVSDKAVRLDRLNDGAPLLFNHDWSDLRGTHVPKSVTADDDGVLRGKVRITSATQAGRDTIGLVESGVLTKASVGYQIHAVVEQTTSKSGEKVERHIDGVTFERLLAVHCVVRDGRRMPGDVMQFRSALDAAVGKLDRAQDDDPVYLVTDWEPLEDSLVTIPADNSVGVGRSAEKPAPSAEAPAAAAAEPANEPVSQPAATAAASTRSAIMADPTTTAANTAANPNPAAVDPMAGVSALDFEKMRRKAIDELCKANRIDDRIQRRWVEEGTRLEEIATKILEVIEERGKATKKTIADVGFSAKDNQRYSIFRAIRTLAGGASEQSNKWREEAAFELECSRQVAKQLGREPDGIFIPGEVLRRPIDPNVQQRAMTAQPGSSGGFLVETDNMGFIEILRNRSVLARMGARNLSGLVGNITIPRQTAAGTLVWQAGETTTATPADQTLGQLSMTPKTAIAVTEVGRQLMLQSSPSAESMIMADLAQVVGLGVDLAGIAGTGGAQPIGIINTTGITTGQDAATATYAKILGFQSAAAAVNAILGNPGYVTTPAVAAALMSRSRFANTDTPLWDGNILDGTMAGFKAMSSVQIPSGDLLFGSWDQVVIGEWGVLELTVNPYQSFNAGVVGIRAMYTVDVLTRYPQAFVLSTNVS